MNLDYILMPVGFVLLCVPATVISKAKVREKLRQVARRHENGLHSLARNPMNWVDFIRAAAGAWMIQHALPLGGSGQDELAVTDLVAQLAVFSVAVLVQTLWPKKPVTVIGPLFYLGGLSLVLAGPLVAGFALALCMSIALLVRRLSLFFVIVPVCLVIFGALFHAMGLMTAFSALAFVLPAFLSFALRTRISFARLPADPKRAERESKLIPIEQATETAGVVITPDFTSAQIKVARESLA